MMTRTNRSPWSYLPWQQAPSLTSWRLRRGPRLTPTQRRAWPFLLVLLALLTTGLVGWTRHDAGPHDLSHVSLTGDRGPACKRILLAADTSGSMTSYATPRGNAVAAYLAWAPTNLRPDDELGVLEFSGTAAWTRPPRPIADPTPSISVGTTDGTALTPVLDLVAALPPSPCDTNLLVISDAQIPDLPEPANARTALTQAHIHDIALLVPSPSIEIPVEWVVSYPTPAPIIFDGLDPDSTAIAMATATATLTNQSLTSR